MSRNKGIPYGCFKVLFEDGSYREYDIPWPGDEFAATVDAAMRRLFKRLARLGKWAGRPGEDLRRYNGNHATKKGRDPGPKAIKIVDVWMENA